MAEIEIRKVWASNLVAEIKLMREFLPNFPIISMDTEFPGTVFKLKPDHLLPSLSSPSDIYTLMKRNVDALCLIQLGLTLSDGAGNLPHLNGRRIGSWEFNFADFDSASHPHDPDSLALLERQGVDFHRNRLYGVDSRSFALLFKLTGLSSPHRGVTWVTFHGTYDLGFMVKILSGRRLPESVAGFAEAVCVNLGPRVYDVKPVARACGVHGGLEKIGKGLALKRALGKNHQAGSDSLLTMLVFMELLRKYGRKKRIVERFNYVFYGLTDNVRQYE